VAGLRARISPLLFDWGNLKHWIREYRQAKNRSKVEGKVWSNRRFVIDKIVATVRRKREEALARRERDGSSDSIERKSTEEVARKERNN